MRQNLVLVVTDHTSHLPIVWLVIANAILVKKSIIKITNTAISVICHGTQKQKTILTKIVTKIILLSKKVTKFVQNVSVIGIKRHIHITVVVKKAELFSQKEIITVVVVCSRGIQKHIIIMIVKKIATRFSKKVMYIVVNVQQSIHLIWNIVVNVVNGITKKQTIVTNLIFCLRSKKNIVVTAKFPGIPPKNIVVNVVNILRQTLNTVMNVTLYILS